MNLFAAVLARASGVPLVDDVADATHAHLTPTELRRLLADGRLEGLHVTVAGDRLPAELHRSATDAGAEVDHYYGAAELSFVAWGAHEEQLRPFPGAEVRVLDGVIWVRSPYLADVATDADGFATVGDRGRVTADGRVLVGGRGAASVTTGGATVAVEPLEAALAPVVAGEVAVVGAPHAELGEVVAAVLTSADDLPAAQQRARERLQPAQRPRLWFFVDGLPRTAAGKTDRAALRALVASGGLRRLSPVAAR
jgi:acyl-coenzyme A synthetase/AMP-(fatty) acid ligase